MKTATITEKVNDSIGIRDVLEKHKTTYLAVSGIEFDFVDDEFYLSPDGKSGIVHFSNDSLIGDVQASNEGQGKAYVMYELEIK